MNAGQKRVLPHLSIPGVTPVPQKKYSSKGSRRVLNLLVAVNKKNGIFVKELTGTAYNGCKQPQQYRTKEGKDAKALTSEEYIQAATEAVEILRPRGRRSRCVPPAILVHDRGVTHVSTNLNTEMAKRNVVVVNAPPRSPDLMPLDYAIFGTAKNTNARDLPATATWEEQVAHLEEILRKVDPGPAVSEFPMRLKACIEAHGEHIESLLHKLKREQRVAA
jgi:hypothetical protein